MLPLEQLNLFTAWRIKKKIKRRKSFGGALRHRYGGFRQPQRGIHTCEGIHSYRKFGGTSMQQTEVFTSQNSEEESSNGSGSGEKLWPYVRLREKHMAVC